jgi:hypothetical protein
MEAGSRDFHHHNLELLYQSDYASLFRVKQHLLFVPVSRPQDHPMTTDTNQASPPHTTDFGFLKAVGFGCKPPWS